VQLVWPLLQHPRDVEECVSSSFDKTGKHKLKPVLSIFRIPLSFFSRFFFGCILIPTEHDTMTLLVFFFSLLVLAEEMLSKGIVVIRTGHPRGVWLILVSFNRSTDLLFRACIRRKRELLGGYILQQQH
jgi:hypothetical protein